MNYEIIHDTIAKQVFEKASVEARTRRKIEKFIRERFEAHQLRGAKLTQDDLDYISPYLTQVNISSETSRFIEQNRVRLIRSRRRIRMLVVGALLVLFGFSAVSWNLYRSAKRESQKAMISDSLAQQRANEAQEATIVARQKTKEAVASDSVAKLQTDTARVERDNAQKQSLIAFNAKKSAEAQADIANAQALAANAKLLINTEPELALKLIKEAYHLTHLAPPASVEQALSNLFYDNLTKMPILLHDLAYAAKVDQIRFIDESDNFLSFMQDGRVLIWGKNGVELGKWPQKMFAQKIIDIPQQKAFLILDKDNRLQIWSSTGRLLSELGKLEQGSRTLAFSKTGKKLLVVDGAGLLRIWDNQTQSWNAFQVEGVIKGAIAPSGSYLAVIQEEGTQFFDMEKDSVISHFLEGDQKEYQANDVVNLGFNEDEEILTLDRDDVIVKWTKGGEWAFHDPEILFRQNNVNIVQSEILPNGGLLLLIDQDYGAGEKRMVQLWNSETLKKHQFGSSRNGVSASNSADYFLTRKSSFSLDSINYIWNEQGAAKGFFPTDYYFLDGVFSPNDDFLVMINMDHTLSIWELGALSKQKLDKNRGQDLLAEKKEMERYKITDGGIQLFDGKGAKTQYIKPNIPFDKLVVSSSGKLLLTFENYGQAATLWNAKGEKITTIAGIEEVSAAQISSDDRYIKIITYLEPTYCTIYDIKGRKIEHLTALIPEGMLLAEFLPQSPYLLTHEGSLVDAGMGIWDFKGILRNRFMPNGFIDKLEFSPSGKFMITSAGPNISQMWTEQANIITNLERNISDFLFSPNEDFLFIETYMEESEKYEYWRVATPLRHYQFLMEEASLLPLAASEKARFDL